MAANQDHTCATQTDHTLWCWGNNADGQLGDGTTTNRLSPTQVGTGTSWAALSAGFAHTCATQLDDSLWCWGDNATGQLGNGTTTAEHAPTLVGANSTWVSVAAGGQHTCATRTDKSLWCWGDNSHGELGQGKAVLQTSVAESALTPDKPPLCNPADDTFQPVPSHRSTRVPPCRVASS